MEYRRTCAVRRAMLSGLALLMGVSVASAQPQGAGPPTRELAKAPALSNSPFRPGKFLDASTGATREQGPDIMPIVIPYDGVFPNGTLPQPEREAGRPMRPFDDIYIPAPGEPRAPEFDDQNANDSKRFYSLMQSFAGPGPNGLTPPDPDLARGYDYEVAVTNDDFAVYDSCGNELYYSDINDYLGISDFCFDPKVIFDPWAGRWVMMYHTKDESPQESSLLIIVTGSSTPFGVSGSDVWYYRFNMVQDAGTGDASWLDYADLGYSNTQLFASGNMFRFAGGFRWARIIVFDKSEIYAKVSASYLWWHNLSNDDGSTTTSPRSAKLQWSWTEGGQNIDAYYVNGRGGGGSAITFWKVRDAFGANTLTNDDTAVGAYTTPPDAQEPTGETLDTIDCRLMTAVVTGDTLGSNGIELFTGHNADRSGDSGAMLYKFDAVSRALEYQGNFGATGLDYWFPCSAADYSGSNFWVFTRTGFSAGNEPEIRYVEFDRGSFTSSSTQIRDGDGSYNGFRWGDYFGGQLDWGDYSANNSIAGRPAKVWLYAEYGENDSWNTHVGASSVFPQGDLTGVSPAGAFVSSGPPGGPFAPASQVYTLQSAAGDTGVAFEVTSLPSWLDASRTYGQLWTDTTVTLSINSNANGLGLGTYNDTVTFSDCYTGGNSFNRSVQLNVQAPDLEVVSLDVGNGTFNPGDSITVSGQYRNNGNLATGNYTADFYASENTFISTLDTLLGSRNYSSLGAGATTNFGPHFLTLPCMPEDSYYIGVIVTVTGDADTSDNTGLDATPIGYELCPGDFNGDCAVDTRDVIAFLNAWSAKLRSADCDGNGVVDTRDVTCFLNLWTSAC